MEENIKAINEKMDIISQIDRQFKNHITEMDDSLIKWKNSLKEMEEYAANDYREIQEEDERLYNDFVQAIDVFKQSYSDEIVKEKEKLSEEITGLEKNRECEK